MAKIIGNTTVTPVMPSDWAQTDETKVDYIKNKPTKLSQFENDKEFVENAEIEEKVKSVGDGYYAKESNVFDEFEFKWTDFKCFADGANGIIGTVSEDSIVIDNAEDNREFVQIVCRDNTLGFTLSVTGYGRLRINGEYREFEDETATIPVTALTDDLYFYGYGSSWYFTDMKCITVKGVAEIEGQVGDIDTALDNIITMMEAIAPMASLPGEEEPVE